MNIKFLCLSIMIDYELSYKTILSIDGDWGVLGRYDVFISAYEATERVQRVFSKVEAGNKFWLIFPEYKYTDADLPSGEYYSSGAVGEADYIKSLWKEYGSDIQGKRVCVDTTAFIRPYLLFLLRWFKECGVKNFDAIYSEPAYYAHREETRFSGEEILEVRQVAGFEGNHVIDTSNDVMIINPGYEEQLIAAAAEHKEQATKIQLFGFPSLRADMFQENILRAHRAEEALGSRAGEHTSTYFAPSNDPFVTASVLHDLVEEINARKPITNLYLCPLATKAQLMGFALYYLSEWRDRAASIVYPFYSSYERKTTTGISRIWLYCIELPSY